MNFKVNTLRKRNVIEKPKVKTTSRSPFPQTMSSIFSKKITKNPHHMQQTTLTHLETNSFMNQASTVTTTLTISNICGLLHKAPSHQPAKQ